MELKIRDHGIKWSARRALQHISKAKISIDRRLSVRNVTGMDESELTPIDADFNYSIQYPIENDEEKFWPNSGKELVILMFDWMGAKDKHLKKYSEIYSTRGLD